MAERASRADPPAAGSPEPCVRKPARRVAGGAAVERRDQEMPEFQRTNAVLRPDRLGYEDGGEDRSKECDLVIGFDFGTSTSKIVVQALEVARFVARRRAADDGGTDWLWPSALHVDGAGVCSLDGSATSRRRRGIKLALMEAAARADDAEGAGETQAMVAAYLGLTLRAARSRILETHAGVLGSFEKLHWSVNMGIPSGSSEDSDLERSVVESNIENLFRGAIVAGWQLSLRPTEIRLADAERALQHPAGTDSQREGEGTLVEIEVFPEVIGGAYGYANSDFRRDGLHLVVDVGASTVDACLFRFRIADDQEDWPLLEARVKRLGVAELHRKRIEALGEMQAESLRDFDPLDGLAPVPRMPWAGDEAPAAVAEADDCMTRKLHRLVGGLIAAALNGLDPNAAELKTGGEIPIVLMGGGSRADFYLDALREWGKALEGLPSGHRGIRMFPAVVPEDLDPGNGDDGHRLAVAFGLSHSAPNLPVHTPRSAIRAVPRPAPVDRRRDCVGKDQV